MFTIGESRIISHSNDTGQQAQQVAGNPRFSTETVTSAERRLKFIASGEDDDNKKPRAKHREHRLAQRRQRRQHSDEKYYNYAANGSDEEREHRLPTLQKAMGTQEIPDLLAPKDYTQSPYSSWSEEFQVSISSDPPFLKSCVALLHSSFFADQSPTDY